MSKIITTSVLLALLYAFAYTAYDTLTLPVVAYDHITNECVWVEEMGTEGKVERRDCSQIPKRHDWYYAYKGERL